MRIFTIIGIVALVVGGYFAYQAWFTPATDNPFDFDRTAAPIIALTLLIIGVTFTVVGTVITRITGARRKLLSQGVAGRAEVMSAAETGMRVNEQPVVKLELNVTVPGRSPYTVSHREVVPLLALGMITPGHVLPVAVDPTDPDKLAIDWSGETAARTTTLGAPAPQMPISLNTLGAMPAMPQTNSLPALPQAGQSLPMGMAGGVGFGAVTPPPSSAQAGMAAYLNYLRGAGVAGRGVVRSAQDTGVAVQGNEVLMLQLDVTPNGGATYPVTMTAIVPPALAGRAVPGSAHAIWIDRSNPQAVAIDWDAG